MDWDLTPQMVLLEVLILKIQSRMSCVHTRELGGHSASQTHPTPLGLNLPLDKASMFVGEAWVVDTDAKGKVGWPGQRGCLGRLWERGVWS